MYSWSFFIKGKTVMFADVSKHCIKHSSVPEFFSDEAVYKVCPDKKNNHAKYFNVGILFRLMISILQVC